MVLDSEFTVRADNFRPGAAFKTQLLKKLRPIAKRVLCGGRPLYYKINGDKTPISIDKSSLVDDVELCLAGPVNVALPVAEMLSKGYESAWRDRVYLTPNQIRAIHNWATFQGQRHKRRAV